MRIGYARVSTTEQNSDLQRRALREAGCIRICEDHGISGSRADRKGLTASPALARSGDHLIVWRLDRLGRSLAHLIATLQDRGVELSSLREQIDTTNAGGRFYLHILAATFNISVLTLRRAMNVMQMRRSALHPARPIGISEKRELPRCLIDALPCRGASGLIQPCLHISRSIAVFLDLVTAQKV